MSWIDDIAAEIEHRAMERGIQESNMLHRRELIKDQAPLLFGDLIKQVNQGIAELGRRDEELRSIVCDPLINNHFTVRNFSIRPMTKVTASLHTMSIMLVVETRGDAMASFTESGNHRIVFGLDSNDRLMLCVNCEQLGVDEVAKLIMRPVCGLS